MVARHGMPEPEDRAAMLDYLEQTFPQRMTPRGGGFRNPFMK